MKKVILIMCFAFAFSQTSYAQLDFGIKGGINYNSNSIKDVSTDVFDGAKSKTGYHAGIWLRAEIPTIGLYIRPELVYTNLENELLYNAEATTYSFQKIDVPVLIGKKFFGIVNAYVGPSFQYILDSEFDINDISDVKTKNFSMGVQFGGGLEFGSLGIDIRWERAFSDLESSYVNNLGNKINYDTRINQIILGLSYKL